LPSSNGRLRFFRILPAQGHREAAIPAKVPGLVAPGFWMLFNPLLSFTGIMGSVEWWRAIHTLRLLVPGTLPTRRRAMNTDTDST
jgi:hypothetical protein